MEGEPPRISPYTPSQKVARVLWTVCAALLWKWTPRWMNGWRTELLRVFGARVGKGVYVDRSVRIEMPWNLQLGEGVHVSEHAILYCLGTVTIGSRSFLGPYVHICAGTHDYTDPRFTLIRAAIRVGTDCVLMTAAFVGPEVNIADRCIILPRAGVFSSTDPALVYRGNPARAMGPRH